jgi:acyl carrier protein
MHDQDDFFDTDPRVAQILTILAKEAAIDRTRLQSDVTIEELGVDSLDLTMAVFQLETVLDITIPTIPERAGSEFGTVGELVEYVIAAMNKAERERAAGGKAEPHKVQASEISVDTE